MNYVTRHADHGQALIAPLPVFTARDLDVAGGKAANLGELVRAGFPVPPGFVVTTKAYEQLVAHNGLFRVIENALAQGKGPGAVIREAFSSAAIPPDVEQQLAAAYEELGQKPVAVRSSATAEDLPEAAFAGQQDTYLNVVGTEAMVQAVRACWASLWTDRAIAYRQRLGLDQQMVKIAVVVQRMVDADVAGVLFTANPITGARDEMVVDANPGLGEAVVSGQATPDHYVLKRRTGSLSKLFPARQWHIVERRIGQREVVIRALEGGGIVHDSGPAVDTPALSDEPLRRLARLGEAIQEHFGQPQDVEWAWAGDMPYILQARPITALPEPAPRANRLQRMLASNFAEMLPVRPYPLDLTAWLPAVGSAVEPIFELIGLDWHLRYLFVVEDGTVLRMQPQLPRPTWRMLVAPLRLLAHVVRYKATDWDSDPLLLEAQKQARQLESLDLQALSWKQLLATLSEAKKIPIAIGEVRVRYFPSAAFALLRLRLLLGLLGKGQMLGTLLSGAGSKTLEANQALEALAGKVRSEPELRKIFSENQHEPDELWTILQTQPVGRTFLAGLRQFLDSYGHRETVLSTALEPSWKDMPQAVLGMVQSFVKHPSLPVEGRPAWEDARDSLLRHPFLRFPPLRSWFLRLLTRARVLLPAREDTHFYATLALPVFRRTALELGRRLVAAGALNTAEEVFYLQLEELDEVGRKLVAGKVPQDVAVELQAIVARRKEARLLLQEVPLVDPRLLPQPSASDSAGALLQGTPGSPGTAQGPVCIVRGTSEFSKLQPGDILVAPYTNPSWTPLFQRAAAVVVDSGSPASHAAIVAREYGIPAVMATLSGTKALADDDLVRVDGRQGLVFRVVHSKESSNVE
jgi:pyruvate,water dikinase